MRLTTSLERKRIHQRRAELAEKLRIAEEDIEEDLSFNGPARMAWIFQDAPHMNGDLFPNFSSYQDEGSEVGWVAGPWDYPPSPIGTFVETPEERVEKERKSKVYEELMAKQEMENRERKAEKLREEDRKYKERVLRERERWSASRDAEAARVAARERRFNDEFARLRSLTNAPYYPEPSLAFAGCAWARQALLDHPENVNREWSAPAVIQNFWNTFWHKSPLATQNLLIRENRGGSIGVTHSNTEVRV